MTKSLIELETVAAILKVIYLHWHAFREPKNKNRLQIDKEILDNDKENIENKRFEYGVTDSDELISILNSDFGPKAVV